MKEVSFKQGCSVRAIGNGVRFSVLIQKELPDPTESRYRVQRPEPGHQRRPGGVRVHPQRHVRPSPSQAPAGEQPRAHRKWRCSVRDDLGEVILPAATRRDRRTRRQGHQGGRLGAGDRINGSRTPGRDRAEIQARWRGRRRWWHISLKNVLRNVALPRPDVPVGVTDVVVPDDRVYSKIAGLHGRIPGAPVTRTFRMVLRAARPGLRRRNALGLGRAGAQDSRDTAPQQGSRCQSHE